MQSSPQKNPHVGILIPCPVLWWGPWQVMRSQEWSPPDWISVLIKRPQRVPFLLPCEDTDRRHYEPGSQLPPETESARTLILDFQLPGL